MPKTAFGAQELRAVRAIYNVPQSVDVARLKRARFIRASHKLSTVLIKSFIIIEIAVSKGRDGQRGGCARRSHARP